tara:strand:+ start:2174 stop:3259 length:1086 start_codon:yes stop_codon:yes gene_type:complete
MASATTAVGIVCILMLIAVVFWGVSKLSLPAQNCASIQAAFPNTATSISSFSVTDPEYSHGLRDYYISSAYDVCTAGFYKNDYVNLCALKSAIKQGVRCLDFAVYTVGGQPVVACSSLNEYTVKESYNSIPFGNVLQTIATYAFSPGLCPNSEDPILIHIRLMTKLKGTCNKMAQLLQSSFDSRLLGPRYSFQNRGRNLGCVPLTELRGKVVVLIDQSNTSFLDTELEEYVNLASNAPFMRLLRYTDGVSQCGDPDELLEFNKKNMSIVLPDLAVSIQNYPTPESEALGCQMSALAFQVKDAEVAYDLSAFESKGSAFRLRPPEQRWLPVNMKKPPNPPASENLMLRRKIKLPFDGLDLST